jgi:hypothetical protein
MSEINNYPIIDFNEAKKAIMLFGEEITPTFIGVPGTSKSSLLPAMAEDNGDQWRKPGDHYPTDKYNYIYVECPVKDIPDVQSGYLDRDLKKIVTYIGEIFEMDDPRPKIIMLDEELKSPKLLQIAWQAIKLERMIGNKPFPKGTIVFSTSNNPTDGVGDALQDHGINRVQFYRYVGPGAETWVSWALGTGIHPSIVSWALFNRKKIFTSYLQLTPKELEENDWIFNPAKKGRSFLSLRSMAKCDSPVRNRQIAGPNLTRAALYGTIGAGAAESLLAHIALGNELHSFTDVIAAPDTISVPDKFAAMLHMVCTATGEITTQDELSRYMRFVNRCSHAEVKAIFIKLLAGVTRTKKLADMNPEIQRWQMDNKNYELL